MQAFTEPFVKIQSISVNKLEPKVNYASVAHKILFKERKRTKDEFHRKTQLNKYLPQINAFYAVHFRNNSRNAWLDLRNCCYHIIFATMSVPFFVFVSTIVGIDFSHRYFVTNGISISRAFLARTG